MKLCLYITGDANNQVKKNLTNEIILNGTLRAECSVMNPTIEIETEENISTYNYAMIEEFNRCYFIQIINTASHNYIDNAGKDGYR